MHIQEIESRLRKVLSKQNRMLGLAEDEDREFTTAEWKCYRKLDTEGFDLKMRKEEAELNGGNTVGPIRPSAGFVPYETRDDEFRFDPAGTTERDYYSRYIISGLAAMPHDAVIKNEQRALQAELDVQGGFFVPRAQIPGYIKALDATVFTRARCTKYSIKANEIFAPSLDQDPAEPTWQSELSSGNLDDEMRIGARKIHPHPLVERILVSDTLLRLSSVSPEAIIRDRFAARVGAVLENSAMVGDGVNQYLGLFVDSDLGIDSSRDRDTGTAGVVKSDDLIDIASDLPAQYRKGAVWIASREFLRRISKLKDGSGNYLIKQDLTSEFGSTLLGHELLISEYCPGSDWNTGDYVCIFGNLQHYWVVDALNLRIQRLNELYQATNQVGFHLRMETDGMPVLAAAFKRLKLK